MIGAPTSEFAAAGSGFDVTNLDANLQQIFAVERTWRGPKLPDAVRLDLASLPDMQPAGLTSFLRGIDSDFEGEEDGAPVEPAVEFDIRDPQFGRSGYDELRVVAAGVAGRPAPTDPTVDAVKRMKQRAIEKGLMEMPENGEVDSTWSPELNSVRYELAQQDYNERLGGDRAGAMPVSGVMEMLDKWTSPSGLLAAATELDLFWDIGAVSNEFNSWGDKWRAIQDAKNPWEFGGKLLDAVTGPLDDIIMPVVNWALIGSGVGSLALATRGGLLAAQVGRGGSLLRGLYTAMDVGSAGNLASLGQRSWVSQRLMRSGSEAAQAAGRGLSAWRAATPVKATKAVSQTGMRLGFASQAQDLLPGYQGGVDLTDISPTVRRGANTLRAVGRSPMFLPGELLLAPYNIFTPGTFFKSMGGGEGIGLVSKTASGLYTVAGTAGGRAAIGAAAGAGVGTVAGDDVDDIVRGAVVGAAGASSLPLLGKGLSQTRGIPKIGKFVGGMGDFLQHTSYAPLAQDQRIVNSFHRGMGKALGQAIEDAPSPELRAQAEQAKSRYDSAFATDGFRGAMKAYMNVDDDAVVDGAIAFVTTSAAIDATAAALAGNRAAGNFQAQYHRYRNKLISQLRTFDFDRGDGSVSIQELAASVAMRFSENPEKFNKVYKKTLDDLRSKPGLAEEVAAQQNRIARDTMNQLLSGDSVLPELAQADLLAPGTPGLVAFNPTQTQEGLSALEAYLPQVLPTLDRWTMFSGRTEEITRLQNSALFDGATFVESISPITGRPMKGAEREIDFAARNMEDVDESILSEMFRDATGNAVVAKAVKTKTTAVAAQSAPAGRLTVAKKGTAKKHQLREEEIRLKWLLETWDSVDSVASAKLDYTALATAAGKPLTELKSEQLRALVRSAGAGRGKIKGDPLAHVVDFARRNNISAEQVRDHIVDEASRIANDGAYWQRFGLDAVVRNQDNILVTDPREILRARRRQLAKQQHYTAAQVDVDKLIDTLATTGRADEAEELRILRDGLDEDGYDLVYGKEFMMPHDLARTGSFGDLSARNVHAVTLGNFFKGRMPLEGHTAEVRRQRLALQSALADRGVDVGVEDDMITNIVADLRKILEENHVRTNALIDQIHNQSLYQRVTTALRSGATPVRLEDLSPKNQGEVIERLMAFGHSRQVAEAAAIAVPKFRNASFKDLGLYSFEAKLRQRNELVQFLKLAGSNRGAAVGAVIGGYTGVQAADMSANQSDTAAFGERLLGAAGGALVGGLATKAAGTQAARFIPRAELAKYGYITDTLVRFRDTARFTLSPFFDISRYTEGQMLAQTAAPLRMKNGERVTMPLDMSPTGARRRVAKTLRDNGMDPADAKAAARRQFDRTREEFRHAAKGDFDPEVLDSTGKWFSSVGIMGFNPTDWMTSAFHELRTRGFNAEEAYKHVREMYTYGTQGRSAAELSTNFIFFPFSFQKKALTHIGKWMNDDLARSIMIHDAYKTYEILNERHNLDEFWRDHMPLIEQFNRLNLLSFGLSPGRFGGINASVFEAGLKGAAGLFTPSGVSIRNAVDAAELQRVVRGLTPVLNDINWMSEDLYETWNVVTSEAHTTTRAEVRQGYAEWNEYRQELASQLEAQDFTWSDMQTKPYLADLKLQMELKRAEIGAKYPAWIESRENSAHNRVALAMEKNDRLARAQAASEDVTRDDIDLAVMEQALKAEEDYLTYQGVQVGGNDGWETAPPEVFDRIQARGIQMLQANPKFKALWDKFYRADFGVLEAQI